MPVATVHGKPVEFAPTDRLIDILNCGAIAVPQVCCHLQLGPIQTWAACMLEGNRRKVWACATQAASEMKVVTESARAQTAHREAPFRPKPYAADYFNPFCRYGPAACVIFWKHWVNYSS